MNTETPTAPEIHVDLLPYPELTRVILASAGRAPITICVQAPPELGEDKQGVCLRQTNFVLPELKEAVVATPAVQGSQLVISASFAGLLPEPAAAFFSRLAGRHPTAFEAVFTSQITTGDLEALRAASDAVGHTVITVDYLDPDTSARMRVTEKISRRQPEVEANPLD